jgi:Xaa-Pro aminopeptidase
MIQQIKVQEKLTLLRNEMQRLQLSAYVIPTNDPHLSEYIPDYWKQREWLSGFTGSVGTLVVLNKKAALWTDSRYYIQAEKQLEGTGVVVMKMSDFKTISIPEYILQELNYGAEVGLDARLFSAFDIQTWLFSFEKGGLIVKTAIDLISAIWRDRPLLQHHSPFLHDINYAGKSYLEKLRDLRQKMNEVGADIFPVTALDEVAWLLNIRGSDVNYNPFCLAYCLVQKEKVTVYVGEKSLSHEVETYFQRQGIVVADYDDFAIALTAVKGEKVLLDNAKVSYGFYQLIEKENIILQSVSPIAVLKMQKNEVEIEGIKQAMIKDAVALVQFSRWLEYALQAGGLVTELSVSDKLKECRENQSGFMGESFATIAGYGKNGAIVHYQATEETNTLIRKEGFLLLDSGGHYLHGTTDITRTFALGKLSAQQKKDFTLVLKGHIALAQAKFPKGTRGGQLDVLARQFLWQNGLNYGHGTGHGVGCFLSVHEGPVSIRPDINPTLLAPGMVLSDEPGIYRENEYGIRIENLLLVVEEKSTSFGDFMSFEVLTLFPIDTEAIDFSLLEENERAWLNDYHDKVFNFVSPFLNKEDKEWLNNKCKKIN